jgi:hypothetical protein
MHELGRGNKAGARESVPAAQGVRRPRIPPASCGLTAPRSARKRVRACCDGGNSNSSDDDVFLLKRTDRKKLRRAGISLCYRQRLELTGALSNPRPGVELSRLSSVHERLLQKAAANPLEPRPVPSATPSVLKCVSLVLEQSDQPMRASEIFKAACNLAGAPLLWSTVRSTLSAGSKGDSSRFRRLGWGIYESVRTAGARSAISA